MHRVSIFSIHAAGLAIGVGLTLAVGCGSGGADSGASSGSSGVSSSGGRGGSSSGAATSSGGSSGETCDATCEDGATIVIEESNASGRLEGAVFEACYKTTCTTGELTKNDAGDRYVLVFARAEDASAGSVYANIQTPQPDTLRIFVNWTFYPPETPVDGDAFRITAKKSGGEELFSRSYTATYKTVTVCGVVCKQYRTGP